jgi:hypothetical protein
VCIYLYLLYILEYIHICCVSCLRLQYINIMLQQVPDKLYDVVSSTARLSGIQIDCIGSWKLNYHTITTMTTPWNEQFTMDKTDHHYITEILLKVVLSTINLCAYIFIYCIFWSIFISAVYHVWGCLSYWTEITEERTYVYIHTDKLMYRYGKNLI